MSTTTVVYAGEMQFLFSLFEPTGELQFVFLTPLVLFIITHFTYIIRS